MTHTQVKFERVKAYGAAGGLKSECSVTCEIQGTSDTVNEVKLLVAAAPELLFAAKEILEAIDSINWGPGYAAPKILADAADYLESKVNKAEGK